MKKLVFTSILVLSATALFAEAVAPTPQAKQAAQGSATPAVKSGRMTRAKMAAMQMRHFGGYVNDTRKQRGSLVVVNAQKSADSAWFDPVLAELAKFVKLRIEVKPGVFDFAAPVIQGNASVFVVDDPKLPMSLVAPESKWTLLNVAPLRQGRGEKPQYFKARVQKQLMRALAYLMGAADSQYPMCLCGCVTKPEDLDQFGDFRLPVDLLGKFEKYVEGYGVTPYSCKTYRQACVEGWAPQPTNEYQKAIWDKVHEAPTAPIVIKPEPKKAK